MANGQSENKAKERRTAAVAALRTFLESTPANTALRIPDLPFDETRLATGTVWNVLCPRLLLHCEADGGLRWFDPKSEQVQITATRYHFLEYRCRNCGTFTKTFAVLFQMNWQQEGVGNFEQVLQVMKLGEYLPFSAPVSKRIEKLLGREDLELYRQGIRSEAQGLGIGAASYFRRIVDSSWKRLVAEIREAAEKLGMQDLSIFDDALKENQFSRAVEMLKDAIPAKLRILNGQNPLTVLYKPLSVGLHDLTDAQCLQQAADIRIVLTALLENLADALADQKELTNAVERLRQGPI